jgi:hypothetical protein
VEIFGWNFSANSYSSPHCLSLSSAALVTAACAVQINLFSRCVHLHLNVGTVPYRLLSRWPPRFFLESRENAFHNCEDCRRFSVTDTSKPHTTAHTEAYTKMNQKTSAQETSAGIVKLVSLSSILVAACLLVISLGCGSSSSHTMSAAQAQAVSQEFSTALQSALSTALSSASSVRRDPHPSLAKIFADARPADVHPADSSGCTVSDNGESCNIPVSYSGSCPGGGTIGITGDFDFTLNNSGDGSDSSTLTVTPTNCSVSNETINGNPSVTASIQINFTDDAPTFPITLSETGGITYAPNPSGSCTLNVQYTVSSESSCTVSGTVCGQTVSGSC